MSERDQWVTPSEAADLLGVSRDAIKKRIRRGTIEARKDDDGLWRVRIPAARPLRVESMDPPLMMPPYGASEAILARFGTVS